MYNTEFWDLSETTVTTITYQCGCVQSRSENRGNVMSTYWHCNPEPRVTHMSRIWSHYTWRSCWNVTTGVKAHGARQTIAFKPPHPRGKWDSDPWREPGKTCCMTAGNRVGHVRKYCVTMRLLHVRDAHIGNKHMQQTYTQSFKFFFFMYYWEHSLTHLAIFYRAVANL